jgi:hypothetical protein
MPLVRLEPGSEKKSSKRAFNTDFTEKKIKPRIYTEELPLNTDNILRALSEYSNVFRVNPWLNLLLGEICVKMLALLHCPPTPSEVRCCLP